MPAKVIHIDRIRYQLRGKVYHTTAKKNVARIMVEGLRPLYSNRLRELKVVDFAFDLVAQDLKIPYKRAGLFAWPKGEATLLEDSEILEVTIDPSKALVMHQAWVDLAWGMVERIYARIKDFHKEEFAKMTAEEFFEFFKQAQIYEGFLGDVLFKLARRYFQTGCLLIEYNAETREELNRRVVEMQPRFQGLIPHLDHEVSLGMDIIAPDKIRPPN